MFRQRKDDANARGYFQKSVVLISTMPFVGLYENVIRVVGPLVFQIGPSILEAIFEDIEKWNAPQEGIAATLELAGTRIKYVVPSLGHLNRGALR